MAFSIRTPQGDHLYSMLIVNVHTKAKTLVQKGDLLLTLETAAEKRVGIRAPVDGEILEFPLVAGARLQKPMVVVRMEAVENPAVKRREASDRKGDRASPRAESTAKRQRHPDRTDTNKQSRHTKRSEAATTAKAGGFVQDTQAAHGFDVTAGVLRQKSSVRPKNMATPRAKVGASKWLIPVALVLSIGAVGGGWQAGLYDIPALDQLLIKRSKYLARLSDQSDPNQFETPPAQSERYQRAFEEWMDQ
jgi:hypothetical protein